MPFIPVPFGIKVEVAWTTGSGIAICVHFVAKSTPAAVVALDLTNAIDAFDTWRQALRPLQNSNIAISGIRATDWSVADGITQFTAPSTTPNGSNVSGVLPLNVAACVTHYSGRTGRSRRGRTYIPGIARNEVATGDLLNSQVISVAPAAYAALRTNLLAVGLVQIVASFHANKLPRVTAQGTAISTSFVDAYSDSQRRRLANRGA